MRKENAVFRTAFVSEEGSKLLNRDYFAYVELDDFACYVVADSLDEETGANSAQVAVSCILREFSEHPSMSARSIRRYLRAAHRELKSRQDGLRLRACAALAVTDYVTFRYVAVGNSRALLIRNDRVLYKSRDQSLTGNLLEEGRIPIDKAAVHEERNNLYSYLGQADRRPRPEVSKKRKLENGDVLLLCTRGIWENCDDPQLLDCARETSAPQELTDNVEEFILGTQKPETDNYTLSATFVDKVYQNPKKRWTAKKVLAVAIPIALVLLVVGITLFVRHRIREGKREDMLWHIESAGQYAAYDNYGSAKEEYKSAQELAESLKDENTQDALSKRLLLLEQILLADGALEDGDYDRAQDLYLDALSLTKDAEGMGQDYIGKQLAKTSDYQELMDRMESGEAKEEQGDYAGAIAEYQKAKELAASLYDKESRKEALEKQRAAEEALESGRQEELARLEEQIQKAVEEEQAAAAQENQSRMNDLKNAMELENKGNELMQDEDYISAATYLETAREMYLKLGMEDRADTLEVQIRSCRKLQQEAAKKQAEEEAAKEAAGDGADGGQASAVKQADLQEYSPDGMEPEES